MAKRRKKFKPLPPAKIWDVTASREAANASKTKRRRKKFLGSSERYVVSGPARWKRSLHASYDAAIKAGHACSKQFPNAVCRVEHGLPGLQRTVAECNRNECYKVSDMGRRKRRRKARRR